MWTRRFLALFPILCSGACAAAPLTDRQDPMLALAAVVLVAGAIFHVIHRRWAERRFLRGLFRGAQ